MSSVAISSLGQGALTKLDRTAVSSSASDTGHLSWAPAALPVAPFMVGGIGTPILSSFMNINFAELLHFGDFGFLALPIVAVLSGLILNNFEIQMTKDLIKSKFSHNDRVLLAEAKKKMGRGTKLKMMFHLPISQTVLFSETDKCNMTHRQAELVRRNGSYYIEIETMTALATWDLALESVVPESVREEISLAVIARDARYLANKFREDELRRNQDYEMWICEREIWIHERKEDLERQQSVATIIEAEFKRQQQVGTIVTDEEDYNAFVDDDDYDGCSHCAL